MVGFLNRLDFNTLFSKKEKKKKHAQGITLLKNEVTEIRSKRNIPEQQILNSRLPKIHILKTLWI